MKKQQHTRQSSGDSSQTLGKITQSMMKKFCLKQIFFSIYHLTRIGLSIAIIILITQTDMQKIKQTKQYNRTQQILNLWQKNVIIDIITVSTYNCPIGYQSYSSAKWQGTKQGCLCKTTLNQYDYAHVIPGQCSLKLINAGCTKIDPIDSVPFVFWKTQKLVCVKRIMGLNFYTNLSQSLPSNKIKTCSKNKNYQIQSLQSQPCPITQISNISTTHPYKLPQINYSYTNQSSYPIIDIKLTQYQFCKQYNKQNISPNRFQNYDLQIIQIKNCQDDKDPRIKQIDSITQKQLYTNNRRIYDIIINKLPIYPQPTNLYQYKLGTVQYPPWTIQCRQSQQYNLTITTKLLKFDQQIQKLQITQYVTITIITILGLLYTVICIIRKIIQIRSKYKNGILFFPDSIVLKIDPNLLNNQLKPSLFCQVIVYLILLAMSIGVLVQIGNEFQSISTIQQWFRNSYNCMDNTQYFKQWIQDGYVNNLQAVIRIYIICLLAILVIVCIDFIFLIWRYNRGDLADQNIKDIFNGLDLGIMNMEQKNSDQRLHEKQGKQGHNQKDILQKQYEVDGNINQNNYNDDDGDFDYIKQRQQTGDINIQGHYDTQASDIQGKGSRRLRHTGSIRNSGNRNRKNTTGLQRTNTMNINQTEQSIIQTQQDDLQFNKITLQSPRKNKNNNNNNKNKDKYRKNSDNKPEIPKQRIRKIMNMEQNEDNDDDLIV